MTLPDPGARPMTVSSPSDVAPPPVPEPAGGRPRGVRRRHVAAALASLVVAGFASLLLGVSDLTPADLLHPDAAQTRVLWTSG